MSWQPLLSSVISLLSPWSKCPQFCQVLCTTTRHNTPLYTHETKAESSRKTKDRSNKRKSQQATKSHVLPGMPIFRLAIQCCTGKKKPNGNCRMCVDFTDLNKACPKDDYPLPKIDRLVDSTTGHVFLVVWTLKAVIIKPLWQSKINLTQHSSPMMESTATELCLLG